MVPDGVEVIAAGTKMVDSIIARFNVEKDIMAIVDTGSEVSLINPEVARNFNLPIKELRKPFNIVTANGSSSSVKKGVILDPFGTGAFEFAVGPLRPGLDCILGVDWMRSVDAKIDVKSGNLSIRGKDGKLFCISPRLQAKKSISPPRRAVNLITKKQFKKLMKRSEIEEAYLIEIHKKCVRPKVEDKHVMEIHKTELAAELKELISKYPEVYPETPKLFGAPKQRNISHPVMRIDTGSCDPIKQKAYPLSPELQKELGKQIQELLQAKLIRPSSSPWGSPVLFVKKKDGTYRMVIDYRKLNGVTKSDAYPLPTIQDNLDQIGSGRVFTTLDATQGFLQNPLHEDDIPKTAFTTRYGLFEYVVTPFGLKNSPSAFQRMMNEILSDLLDKCCVVYVDDILIYSSNMDEHFKHLELVSERLNANGIQVNVKKSKFAQESVVYCGFKVEGGRITVDPDKVKAVTNWPAPQTVSAVRSFLGFVGFYRRFIEGFARIAAPLTDLTKKDVGWRWTDVEEKSFETLRDALVTKPVLYCPNEKLDYKIVVDAGPKAVGGILLQDFEDGEHPIAYEHHRLSDAEEKYSQYEKEFLGLLHCLRKWKHYYLGKKVVVLTDNQPLVSLLKTSKDPHHRIARWLEELQRYNPELIHIGGKKNPADALSRVELKTASEYLAITDDLHEVNVIHSESLSIDIDPVVDWPLIIADYLESGSWLEVSDEELSRKLVREERNFAFDDNGNFIRVKDGTKVAYLPSEKRELNMKRFHEGLGHLKYGSIIGLIKRRYWWPDMDNDVKRHIRTCRECQLDATSETPDLPVTPIPSMGLPFERWGIDWIGPLPTTLGGNRYVFTAIDYATRWVVAKAVPEANAVSFGSFLYHDLLLNYGSPFEVITDRQNVFLDQGIQSYMDLQNIRHIVTSPYHPQTNGMVERMHSMIKRSLTTLCDGNTNRWDEYLDKTIFSIRVRTHAVTQNSPFYLLYGVHPRLPGDTDPIRENMIPMTDQERENLLTETRARALEELGQARGAAYLRSTLQGERMAERTSARTEAHHFEIGDMVKMKNHNRQNKLQFDWTGPYHVVDYGHKGTYWLMKPNGQRFANCINQSDLAPWLARVVPNVSYFES